MTERQQPDTTNQPATPGAQEADMADALGSAKATEQPATPSPSAMKPQPGGAPNQAHPVAAPTHQTPLEEAKKFATVTDDGLVTLVDGEEEVAVGQLPEAPKDEAVAYFARKYDEAYSQLLLLEQRLSTSVSTQELNKALKPLEQTIAERQMIGDMDTLRTKLGEFKQALETRAQEQKAQREEAVAEAQQAREKVVEEAEKVAAQEPQRIQWKQSSQKMTDLFEQWKSLQKSGPRLPKSTEDELWARFRTARGTFDKARRAFFSQLDAKTAEAKKVKEKLIARAEEMQNSTDWGPTSRKYRDLMDEWKAAPRGSRKEDDALWARFRAAQDVFFNARKAANDELDAEFRENLKVKEGILDEAQQLLPFKDLKKARKQVQELRGRWEDAGRVPRKDVSRMENGFRKIEDELKKAEDEHWSRTNPETKARTNSAMSQLEDIIAELEADLKKAQEAGDEKKIQQAQEALEARQAWLEVVKANADS